MSTDTKGKILVNFAEKNEFDAGNSLANAMNKIKQGLPLNEYEEYSIEVLWHEILHNSAKKVVNLPDISSTEGFKRAILETTNQYVARKTYPKFLSQLGGEAANQEWILKNGYGYNKTVSNMRSLVLKLGIDETKFIEQAKNVLINKSYGDIDKNILDVMLNMKMTGTKRDVSFLIEMIERDDFENLLKILD